MHTTSFLPDVSAALTLGDLLCQNKYSYFFHKFEWQDSMFGFGLFDHVIKGNIGVV